MVSCLDEKDERGLDQKEAFDLILQLMKNFLEKRSSEIGPSASSKLAFIIEQMDLLLKKPSGRRYSPTLLATSLVWLNMNSGLYKQLHTSQFLTLPSPQHLRNLSKAITVETGDFSQTTEKYLTARIKNLTLQKKHIVVILDEVYVTQRVEFVRGKFLGHENDQATKTVLCFMIRSICGKYRDVVALLPVAKISAKFINDHFVPVRTGLWKIGFTIVAMSVDNHTANRKFYTDFLCDGTLRRWIPLPEDEEKKLWLLFDIVHGFKNEYNCWERQEYFVCPDIYPTDPANPKPLRPNFAHLKEIHARESGQHTKIAHKLSLKALNPTSIEKTSVKLADAIFHESTIASLKFYSDEKPDYDDTYQFAQFVRNHWNVLNVKTPYVGRQKRDELREPISNSNTMPLAFLREYAGFLEEWENSGERGFTAETFLAVRHTTLATAEMAEYLLETGLFQYILTAMFTSDPIEERFGWYRQLGGGNFYISVRQLLEAEKKIRVMSLVKYDNLNMKEIKELLGDTDIGAAAIIITNWVPTDLQTITTAGESNALYYVAGYIAFSLKKKVNCTSCRLFLSLEDTPPENIISFEADSEEEQVQLGRFIEIMSRGGLSTPSDLLFLTCLYAHSLFDFINTHEEEKEALMSAANPRASFITTFSDRMLDSSDTAITAMMNTTCDKGHTWSTLLNKISQILFNVMGKNYAAKLNDDIRKTSKKRSGGKQSNAEKKIAKLQSNSN